MPFVLFAYVLAARPQQAPRLRDDRFARVEASLRNAGYRLKLGEGYMREGTISRNGRCARVRLMRGSTYTPAMLLGTDAVLLQLATEFGIGRDLPQNALPRHEDRLLPRGTILFLPSLGRTAAAYADVVSDGRTASEGARREVDRYFSSVEAYASKHGGRWAPLPARDWRRAPLSESLRLNEPDEVSVLRLLESWGFLAKESAWEEPWLSLRHGLRSGVSHVESVEVSLYDPADEWDSGSRRIAFRSEFVLPEGVEAKAWVRRHAPKKGSFGLKTYIEGRVVAEQELSLATPMSSGELKRRLVAFAQGVRALKC